MSDKVKKLKNESKQPKVKVLKLKKSKIKSDKPKKGLIKVIFGIGGYFKGAWQELRQVRWTNRKATWGLTLAVIFFTGFFVALIMLLDFGFQALFKLILK